MRGGCSFRNTSGSRGLRYFAVVDRIGMRRSTFRSWAQPSGPSDCVEVPNNREMTGALRFEWIAPRGSPTPFGTLFVPQVVARRA